MHFGLSIQESNGFSRVECQLRNIGAVPQNVNFAVKSDYILPVLNVAGINVERNVMQDQMLDPVTIMDMGKSSVVYVKSYRE